jgi:hypothetical protein
VRQAVTDERKVPQDDVNSDHGASQADEGSREKSAYHEGVLQRVDEPVHG